MTSSHQQLLDQAAQQVAQLTPRAAADPLRPRYHVATPAGWINDPNGPLWYDGAYHLFLQHTPAPRSGLKYWAHVVSQDLAHWEHWPLALAPEAHAGDGGGVWSGCCVLDGDTPTALYTGVMPEVQCLAVSHDGLRTFTKRPAGPVITTPPRSDLEGFRDPYVWREGDHWRMVIGSGIPRRGGAVLLYRSNDLHHWDYLGELCTGFGCNWECPLFFPLRAGDDTTWMLTVSPHDQVRYSIGTYRNDRFTPGPWLPLDLAGPRAFYAPNGLLDPRGRRIIWGWINCGHHPDSAWTGMLTLPRVLTLRPDGRLAITPAPELAALRGPQCDLPVNKLSPDQPVDFPNLHTTGHEIELVFNRQPAGVVAVHTGVTVAYDLQRQLLSIGYSTYDLPLLPDEDVIHLHIFRDRCVLEVYVNQRQVATCEISGHLGRVGDQPPGAQVFAREQAVALRAAHAWDLHDAF